MTNLYNIYKKFQKKIKYSLYINPEKYNNIFDFLKNESEINNYIISIVSKNNRSIKQGTFINYDCGILILKDNKNNTLYEYIKNYHLFIENISNLEKEDQLEKYNPIVIDIDIKSNYKEDKNKNKHKKKGSMRQSLETLLEDINEDCEE